MITVDKIMDLMSKTIDNMVKDFKESRSRNPEDFRYLEDDEDWNPNALFGHIENKDVFMSVLNLTSKRTGVPETNTDFSNVVLTIDYNHLDNLLMGCLKKDVFPTDPLVEIKGYSEGLVGYGLSDSISQIIDKYGKDHIIFAKAELSHELEEGESSYGGFRFHKWGEYIGVHQDEVDSHEYLSDSKLKMVWIYQVKDLSAFKVK